MATTILPLDDLLWEELLMVLCHRDSPTTSKCFSWLARVALFLLELGDNNPSLGSLSLQSVEATVQRPASPMEDRKGK